MRSLIAIPVLALVALLAVGAWGRWRFARSDGAFRCGIRACGSTPALWPRLPRRWRRRHVWARWHGQSLVVRRGRLFPRLVELPVRTCGGHVRSVRDGEAGRRRCIAVEFILCDGSRVEVIARQRARADLVGPYVAAALHGLPPAAVPPRSDRHAGP
jgi:hypothetical protein